MASLTAVDLAVIGAVAGSVEVTLQQPLVGVKNALQMGTAIPRSPVVLYRGWLVNCASIAPINCIQFSCNRAMQLAAKRMGVAEGPALTVGLAGAAGVASAVVSCPAELVMLHQQTSGAKMVPATRQLVATHGPLSLWRGMVPTMMRECLWVGAYLGSVPVLEEGLRSTEALRERPTLAWAAAATTAGIVGAVATQPLDTIKTAMQARLEATAMDAASFVRTARNVAAEGKLFAGLTPRATRMVGASYILSYVREKLSALVEERRR